MFLNKKTILNITAIYVYEHKACDDIFHEFENRSHILAEIRLTHLVK